MVHPSVHQFILHTLQLTLGTATTSISFAAVGGGSINHTYRITANTGQHFCAKINSVKDLPGLFAMEKQGLELLAHPGIIRVPKVIAVGETDYWQILLLEWIEGGLKTPDFWKQFGEQLAALHQVSAADFGLTTNNYMGALPQQNEPLDNWPDFFIRRRLMPQVKLAASNSLLTTDQASRFERLYKQLPGLFDTHPPALLHGDLWSGNFLCDEHHQPVLIDPAVYYGHPSVDLALTTLFGGFEPGFYQAYQYQAPFPPNHQVQWQVANLYPLLIHLNLFGKAYLSDILYTINHY